MRVIQVLTTISFGDAVSNDTLALKDILIKYGYKTNIYAEHIDKRIPNGSVLPISQIPKLNEADIIIYHLSTGTALNYQIGKMNGRKIVIYHNITPPCFFEEYSAVSYELCKQGLDEAVMLKDTFDYAVADSEFNKSDLIKMGYECPIDVLPILIPFEDYKKKPNRLILKKYDDDYTNIIFVGRIAPNKKQEDIIESFYYYQKYYNKKSRLILVGSYRGMENYYVRLQEYASELGAEHVVFTGHIKFDEILAYYHLAHLFLCESEHEGFCVPLVEAMFFNVPILAYDSCAIAGTLGGSGILLKQKKPLEVAGVMNRILSSQQMIDIVKRNQQERLADFDNEVVEKQFMEYLEAFIAQKGNG